MLLGVESTGLLRGEQGNEHKEQSDQWGNVADLGVKRHAVLGAFSPSRSSVSTVAPARLTWRGISM